MLTDDNGIFDFTELPAGRYTLTVSKSGFVALSYGQRRPLQAGTPLQLADGQQLKDIDFQLPRGSVIGGRVLDEDGDAMPGVTVRVMRYQYLQGERRLTPAGNGQTDDKGQYRVWGLMPGDYYVNAVARGARRPGGPGSGSGARVVAAADSAVAAVARRSGGQDRRRTADQVNYAPTYYPGVAVARRGQAGQRRPGPGNARHQLRHAAGSHVAPLGPTCENPDGTPVTSGNVNLSADVGGRPRQPDRHELRRPHRLGRFVHDQQRGARTLHAARARRRFRRAAIRVAAGQH